MRQRPGLDRLINRTQAAMLARGLRTSKWHMLLFVALTIITSMCSIAGPLIFVHAVGDIARPIGTLFTLFVLFAAATAAARFLQDAKMVLMNRVQQDVGNISNDELLHGVMNADGSLFVKVNAGKISALVQNFNQSNTIYVQMFMMVIMSCVSDVAVSMVVVGANIDPIVAAFVVVYGALTVWITLRSNEKTEKHLRVAQGQTNENANLLGNVVANIISIRVYRGQAWVAGINRRNYQESRHNWNAFYARRIGYSGMQGALVLLQYSGAFAVLLWLRHGGTDLSRLLLLALLLGLLNRPFELLATSLRDFTVAKSMAEPMIELLHDHAHEAADDSIATRSAAHIDRAPIVEVEELTYRYTDAAPAILDRLNATFGPGCLNFIVGPTGVGKSTLMSILLRLRTSGYTGVVRVDDVALDTFDDDSYWAHVGYVPQEPMMMNLSIRENVLLGRNFPDDAVRSVLDRVGLGRKLAELPDGLDHSIGEGGRLFSGGEKQRLSIARALIGQPRLLFLDEASSALDAATEAAIMTTLRGLVDDTTIIAITHRTETITDTDHVLNLAGTPVAAR